MTDRPILFSASMIRALLDGRKTQTRRVIADGKTGEAPAKSPRFVVGDRLWVRETHAVVGSNDPGWVLYRANGYEAECSRHGFDEPYPPEAAVTWRPSIFMPRWASRLTLIVTDVRVQRLREISWQDAKAEGISGGYHQSEFATLWDGINDKRPGCSWADNPWIVAVSFDPIEQNIDQIGRAA